MQATFKHGNPIFIPYTPTSGDIAAGDVIVLRAAATNTINGITTGIAHGDIANNVEGALAVGGGVYEATSLQNNADYIPVYWDDSVDKLTTTATNNGRIGFITGGGGAGANTAVEFLHVPYVSPAIL
jgi:hypothetical protein